MAKKASMDVVSNFDNQEVKNIINTTNKELANRYDFKNVKFSVELKDEDIEITSESENKNLAIIDTLISKAIKRSLSAMIFKNRDTKEIGGSQVKTTIHLQNGINQDDSKKIIKELKKEKFKVEAQIQGDLVRISSKDIDELQKVIAFLKEYSAEVEIPLQFINFRS